MGQQVAKIATVPVRWHFEQNGGFLADGFYRCYPQGNRLTTVRYDSCPHSNLILGHQRAVDCTVRRAAVPMAGCPHAPDLLAGVERLVLHCSQCIASVCIGSAFEESSLPGAGCQTSSSGAVAAQNLQRPPDRFAQSARRPTHYPQLASTSQIWTEAFLRHASGSGQFYANQRYPGPRGWRSADSRREQTAAGGAD